MEETETALLSDSPELHLIDGSTLCRESLFQFRLDTFVGVMSQAAVFAGILA